MSTKRSFITFCLLSTVVGVSTNISASVKYNPADVKQFVSTGQCQNCDLTNADLSLFNMSNVNVNKALLTEANLGSSSFPNSNFTDANLVWSNIQRVNFSGCNFTNANLEYAYLAFGNFSRCIFTGANISGVDLSNSILIQATISNAQLATTKSLSCAIMPDGTRHAPDPGQTC